MKKGFLSPSAAARVDLSAAWLAERSPCEQIVVATANREAASEIVRRTVLESEGGAAFGWNRATVGRLAAEIASDALADQGLVPLTRLGTERIVARVIQELRGFGALDRYEVVSDRPGFAQAVAATLEELRLGLVSADRVEKVAPGLSVVVDRYVAVLAEAHLADRALVYEIATRRLQSGASHPWVGLPVFLLDVPIHTAAEAALVTALTSRAPETLATIASGDEQTLTSLAAAGFAVEAAPPPSESSALARIQAHLFEGAAFEEAGLGEDVVVFSAPGESRECVEIARRLLHYAQEGVRFDQMAVLLRSVEEYRPHLEEAFDRAGIPAYFLVGLGQREIHLTCKGEGCSPSSALSCYTR
jgi:ATP-dependent helicase/nuclease subunit B